MTDETQNSSLDTNKDKTPEKLQAGDILNFVSAISALTSAAIFYVSGWLYEAHWYAYYNINTGMVNLPIERVMIQGVPGIFLLSLSVLISILIVMQSKRRLAKKGEKGNESLENKDALSISTEDIPTILVWSNGISGILLLTFTFIFYSPYNPIPIEVLLSLGILSLQMITLYIIYDFTDSIAKAKYRVPHATRKFLPYTDEEKRKMRLQKKETEERRRKIFSTFSRMKYSWLGFIILNLFLVSISISAVLGQYEASQGTRFLEGNWRLPITYIYSKSSIPSLTPYSQTNQFSADFVYGPFGLVAGDADTIFIAEWESQKPYTKSPKVFIIPRTEDITVSLSTP